MNKELMAQIYKQYDIFLAACMSNEEGSTAIIDESLDNIKKIYNEEDFTNGLEVIKKTFEDSVVNTDDLRLKLAAEEKKNVEAYTAFMDDLKKFVTIYIKTTKIT